jgi:hypothetical protein
VSSQQAQHPLDLEEEPQGDQRLVYVAASSGMVQPIGGIAPSLALA